MPSRCFQCFRPIQQCFCDQIPAITNRTEVLILQHRRERSHPFNTARIVNTALQRCSVLCEHNDELAKRLETMELSANVGLLYPGEGSMPLSGPDARDLPNQLVVVDGTWHHAKTLMRDVPRLQRLPRYQITPASPGRYRIRREPNDQALSTLEATVAALREIEPDTLGFDRLLNVFEQMIDQQIVHAPANWRQNRRRRRGSTNVPRSLCSNLGNVVVAYGEQERGPRKGEVDDGIKPRPVYWIAERLQSDETFACAIESKSLQDAKFAERLRLTDRQIDQAISLSEFRNQWKAFLRPSDTVVVYHQRTANLLRNAGAACPNLLLLKSIQIGSHPVSATLEQFLRDEGIGIDDGGTSRSSFRLANAIAFVKHVQASNPPLNEGPLKGGGKAIIR
ncbi:tRNA-uridine aminocarboxypropyltransferase [Novipirellula artificiosorum]|uniref:tRNA-uridine aminocarboxypropyltransferase n=1 Tax=Novipirellula artificiosorum TaxID=2528016 RepID=A0A5C6DKI0_9BACT|nr:tRNA-uridine aminocarboxypropyltransferase [Novipirellula artificiosorum]TWU37092.1 DTW domain protein [Novipirellula artificiosorum]